MSSYQPFKITAKTRQVSFDLYWSTRSLSLSNLNGTEAVSTMG